MIENKPGSFSPPGGKEPGNNKFGSSLDSMEESNQQIYNLACPSCGEFCAVDPSLFPLGESGAVCSACERPLALYKGLDGSISVKTSSIDSSGQPVEEIDDGFVSSGISFGSAGVAIDSSAHNPSTKHAQENPAKVISSPEASSPKGPTRPVVCPRCLGRYRVPIAKIPKQGAWVTCPSCSERFIVKLDDLSFSEAANPPKPKLPAAPNDSKNKETKPYMYRLWTQEQVGELEVTILDPVTPIVRRYWGIGLGIAIIVIFLAEALILRSSWRSANSMTELQQNSRPTALAPYGQAELAYDLRSLQEATFNASYVDRKIDFTGNVSRVYKRAVSELAPNNCQSVTAIRLASNQPSAWLQLSGTCFNQGERPATVRVEWNGRYANLVIEGFERSGRMDVLIHSPNPASQATAQEATVQGLTE
jgi:predicted Zn finger-like uncharacterized protein